MAAQTDIFATTINLLANPYELVIMYVNPTRHSADLFSTIWMKSNFPNTALPVVMINNNPRIPAVVTNKYLPPGP